MTTPANSPAAGVVSIQKEPPVTAGCAFSSIGARHMGVRPLIPTAPFRTFKTR